jgi:argininosuccinate lyase
MSYNRDLQEDKEPLFDTVETLELVLPLAASLVRGLNFDLERLKEAADDPFIVATDLADHLVTKGVPFRQAHEAVGALVSLAHSRGLALKDLGPERLAAACPQADPNILKTLTLNRLLEARSTTPGGTAPQMVERQLQVALDRLAQEDKDAGGAT